MQLPAFFYGTSLLLLVLTRARAQPAGGERSAELWSLQVPGPGGGRGSRGEAGRIGAPCHPAPRPSLLPSPSLARTSWRRWGSSGRRNWNLSWKTSRRPGLRTAAPSGTSRGRRAARRVPRRRQPAVPSRRRDRASGGASSPPTDGGPSPAALGPGWRGSGRRRGWDATSTKPVGPG